MLRKLLLGVVIGAGSIVGVVGCDKAKETTAEKAKETADKAKVEADKVKENAEKGMKDAEKGVKDAEKGVKEATDKVVAELGGKVKEVSDYVGKEMPAIEAKIKELTTKSTTATGVEKTAVDAQLKEAGGFMATIKEKFASVPNLKDIASVAKAKDEITALVASIKKALGL